LTTGQAQRIHQNFKFYLYDEKNKDFHIEKGLYTYAEANKIHSRKLLMMRRKVELKIEELVIAQDSWASEIFLMERFRYDKKHKKAGPNWVHPRNRKKQHGIFELESHKGTVSTEHDVSLAENNQNYKNNDSGQSNDQSPSDDHEWDSDSNSCITELSTIKKINIGEQKQHDHQADHQHDVNNISNEDDRKKLNRNEDEDDCEIEKVVGACSVKEEVIQTNPENRDQHNSIKDMTGTSRKPIQNKKNVLSPVKKLKKNKPKSKSNENGVTIGTELKGKNDSNKYKTKKCQRLFKPKSNYADEKENKSKGRTRRPSKKMIEMEGDK